MSESASTSDDRSNRTDGRDGLGEDERETFQRLADEYDPDDDIGRIARAVLHSDSVDALSEEARS